MITDTLKWSLNSLSLLLFFNFTFAQNNNKPMHAQIINITTETFKTVKSDDGIVAIVTIKNVAHTRIGTRSEQSHYKVLVEHQIYGKPYDLKSIKHYGKPKIEVDKKYLVFLSGSGRYALVDFQKLECNNCDTIIEICKEKIE